MPELMSILNAYSQLLCLPCRKKLAHGNTAEAFELQILSWLKLTPKIFRCAVCSYTFVLGFAAQ